MGLLGIAALLEFAVVGPVAVHLGGRAGLAAAAVAAVACLAGAAVALLANHLLRGPPLVFQALLAVMAARMGIPLAAGLAIHLQGGPLAKAGILYYVLVFYAVTLAVSTALSLTQSGQSIKPNRAPPETNT